jgi:hypothetical protein
LTVIFARRQNTRREEDGPATGAGVGHPGMRYGGWPGWRRVRVTAVRAAARAGALPREGQRPSCPASYGETPATLAACGTALPRPFNASSRTGRAYCTSPAKGRAARRAEGVPLKK